MRMPRRRARPPVAEPEDQMEHTSNGYQTDGFEGSGEDFEAIHGRDGKERLLDTGVEPEGDLVPDGEFEEVSETPSPRRETRQEVLGRLMRRLLFARDQVHTSLEQVRDYNTELREAGSRPPESLKEQFHRTTAELSQARKEENFARSELIQMLGWRP